MEFLRGKEIDDTLGPEKNNEHEDVKALGRVRPKEGWLSVQTKHNQSRLIPMLLAFGILCLLPSCPGLMKMNS